MVQNTAHFRVQHTDQLTTVRYIDAQQTLDGEAEGVFLVHRRHIVETIQIRDVLKIGARFHQLFGAAVQQTDMRIDASYQLAIQFQHQTQHAVRCRVLWAEIDGELAIIHRPRMRGQVVLVILERINSSTERARRGFVSVSHYTQAPAFSSPGRTCTG